MVNTRDVRKLVKEEQKRNTHYRILIVTELSRGLSRRLS